MRWQIHLYRRNHPRWNTIKINTLTMTTPWKLNFCINRVYKKFLPKTFLPYKNFASDKTQKKPSNNVISRPAKAFFKVKSLGKNYLPKKQNWPNQNIWSLFASCNDAFGGRNSFCNLVLQISKFYRKNCCRLNNCTRFHISNDSCLENEPNYRQE